LKSRAITIRTQYGIKDTDSPDADSGLWVNGYKMQNCQPDFGRSKKIKGISTEKTIWE